MNWVQWLLVGMGVAFIIAWIIAEVRAFIWVRTPDKDPWKKHVIR